MTAKIKLNAKGKAYLHIWREGLEYFNQKSPIFLKEWNSICFSVLPYPPQRGYIYYDIRKPLLSPDQSFDAAHICHIFEHLSLKEVDFVLKELYRVLKSGAVLRISVPDLEHIARNYLENLESALADPSDKNLKNYHWAAWESFDQMVREKCGGAMLEALEREYFHEESMKTRYGDVFNEFLSSCPSTPEPEFANPVKPAVSFPQKIVNGIWVRLRNYYYKLLRRYLLWKNNDSLRFKRESVRWMHDQLSLKLMTAKAGFKQFIKVNHNTSDIPYWEDYQLDRSIYGDYGIDPSVYVECRKP